jgi:hypothetical protein
VADLAPPGPEEFDRPPAFWHRLAARLRREVPAESLAALGRAGAAVYPLHLEVARRTAELAELGRHAWSAGSGACSAALCVANALVLQTIGETLVGEDYAADRVTRGYLPPVTAEQAWACFEQVGPWLSWAQQGLTSAHWDLRDETDLPAGLAVWVDDQDYPEAHVRAIWLSAGLVGEQLDATLGVLAGCGEPNGSLLPLRDRAEAAAEGLRGKLAHVNALWQPHPPDDLLHQILMESRALLDEQFVLGQLLAAPHLVEYRLQARRRRSKPVRLPGPDEAGFDPWCLTSPRHRSRMRTRAAEKREIARMWRCDPEPARTVAIQRQIDLALAAGSIRYLCGTDGLQAAFHTCPWGAIYEVVRPVRIAGTKYHALTQFTVEVSADQFQLTGTFVRRLVRGPFVPAGRISDRVRPMRPARGAR